MNPKFPLYIPSKGRWQTRHTVKSLEAMRVPYHIVVEEQEYRFYSEVIDKANILVLDQAYKRDYDTFSNLGAETGTGSGPARNFIWDHAAASGAEWHWIMDDNINGFYRLHDNQKIRVGDGTVFVCMEEFVQRYTNVAMAGPNYYMFAPRKKKMRPFILNTRIYSCNLIRTRLPYRWRGRYNEDTDLSLRMLKDGWCTILFNAFLQKKLATQTVKGGNTDTIYTVGTLPKSRMLLDMHPDVARIIWKFNRWHHVVDYSGFNQILVRRRNAEIPKSPNNYGMRLVKLNTPADFLTILTK